MNTGGNHPQKGGACSTEQIVLGKSRSDDVDFQPTVTRVNMSDRSTAITSLSIVLPLTRGRPVYASGTQKRVDYNKR